MPTKAKPESAETNQAPTEKPVNRAFVAGDFARDVLPRLTPEQVQAMKRYYEASRVQEMQLMALNRMPGR